MKYSESEEMYLETIHVLRKSHDIVRSVDIANHLGYSKASISVAMKRLREKGYVNIASSGEIILTDRGENLARKIFDRHNILTEFFVFLGADHALAEENACRMEHVISDGLLEIIRAHIDPGSCGEACPE